MNLKDNEPAGVKPVDRDPSADFSAPWEWCRVEIGTTAAALVVMVGLLAGCSTPIGADRVTTRQAYDQVDANALRTGKPGADTVSLLHRHGLDRLAASEPDAAVRELHARAMATRDRDHLFALAELSYVAADEIRHSLKPWDARDARDYYLGSAVYAYLFLFGDGKDSPPSPFDRRFRAAADFYNYSLGLAFTGRRSTNAAIHLEPGRRRLPVGEIEIRLKAGPLESYATNARQILPADRFRIHGLSVRNRDAGIGAPIILVGDTDPYFRIHRSSPATLFLRLPESLDEIASGGGEGSMEVLSSDAPTVDIGSQQVPVEFDLTTYRAYNLSQSTIWDLGMMQFMAPSEYRASQLMLHQQYDPNRIPVVFVHGTFSSPVTWAEMANTLTADPIIRERYQLWSFMYGSGNPLIQSIADLRAALTAEVQRLDPAGTNGNLRRMVIIGHSQGGLLVKGTAVDSGDRIWNTFSTNRLDELQLSVERKAEFQELLFFKPLPFVSRVVFICTPHRGSYLAGGFVRRWAQRLVSLPNALVARSKALTTAATGSEMRDFFRGRIPTSLDGMSPDNPGLLAMADVAVTNGIKSHSIIAVKGAGDYHRGRDGVVAYTSAHVAFVDSEYIVHGGHSCLNLPATCEEVRRILLQHLGQ